MQSSWCSARENQHAPLLTCEKVQAHSGMVGFYFTVGPDVGGLGSVWGIFVILAALVLIVALFFVK